ncbi:hypothetical protein [Massilia scottii]|uniref:hypothetical protein n=1 Tax=Massilia scottii TaxID=3057166 RepID=UPI002796C4FA|nr:hypothetical protein [Massilia sp. CCM 9029]MDQ1829273.1 hypothetical protein [Massilia sp. CCM 9029]
MNFPSNGVRAAIACGILLLTACGTPIPVYVPEAGVTTTKVSLMGGGIPYMCLAGQFYRFDVQAGADGTSTVQVPVGTRLTMRNVMTYQGHNVVSTCRPAFSVIPKEGQTLFVNSGLSAGTCFTEAVREDNSKDTGVALEPSLGAPQC